jgi:hypothetical protein
MQAVAGRGARAGEKAAAPGRNSTLLFCCIIYEYTVLCTV